MGSQKQTTPRYKENKEMGAHNDIRVSMRKTAKSPIQQANNRAKTKHHLRENNRVLQVLPFKNHNQCTHQTNNHKSNVPSTLRRHHLTKRKMNRQYLKTPPTNQPLSQAFKAPLPPPNHPINNNPNPPQMTIRNH